MNKSELVDRLASQLGGRQAATVAVESVVDAIIREVAAGGSVGITGFGTFERVDRAPRTGRNPRTGETVPIEGTSSPRFRPGTYFKNVVTEPGALPEAGLAGGRAAATRPSRPQRSAAGRAAAKKSAAAAKATPSSAKGSAASAAVSPLVDIDEVNAITRELLADKKAAKAKESAKAAKKSKKDDKKSDAKKKDDKKKKGKKKDK